MKIYKFCLFILLSLFVTTPLIADAGNLDGKDYESSLDEAIDLYTKYSLPNTMARSEFFDINEYLKELDSKRKDVTKIFHDDEGVKFLIEKLRTEEDEISTLAILNIIYESKNPLGVSIMKEYCENGDEVVSRVVCEYLNE